jgi:hypothetical protein
MPSGNLSTRRIAEPRSRVAKRDATDRTIDVETEAECSTNHSGEPVRVSARPVLGENVEHHGGESRSVVHEERSGFGGARRIAERTLAQRILERLH